MKISPSKLQAWTICPCFEHVERPDTTDEGQRLHDVMETDDPSRLETEEEQEAVRQMQLYRDSVAMSICALRTPEVPLAPQDDLSYVVGALSTWQAREIQVDCGHGIKGTLDQVFVQRPRAAIIDWKTGRLGLPTVASENRQQQAYVLGLWNLIPDLDEIETHLMNPRTLESDFCTIQRARRPELQQDLADLIKKVENPFKQPCNQDPGLCGNCANASRCPLVCRSLAPLGPYIDAQALSGFITTDVLQLDQQQRGQAYQFFKLAIEFFDQRKDIITKDAIATRIPPDGFNLIQKAGATTISDPVAAREILLAQGVAQNIIDACSKLSMAQLRKQVSSVDDLLAPVVTQGPSIQYLMRKSKGTKKS